MIIMITVTYIKLYSVPDSVLNTEGLVNHILLYTCTTITVPKQRRQLALFS